MKKHLVLYKERHSPLITDNVQSKQGHIRHAQKNTFRDVMFLAYNVSHDKILFEGLIDVK